MPKDAVIILIIIFILAGLSWQPASNKSSNQGSTAIGTLQEQDTSELESSSPQEVSRTIAEAEKQVAKINQTINNIKEESVQSPYYNKVRMSRISNLNNPDPSREYIRLTTNLGSSESVDISGWYLKSERTGNWVTIGQVSLLPYPYTRSEEQDIVLHRGDTAYLIKGFSPIGIAFRTNICTGYFEENRTFYPSLSRRCPLPRDEELPTFSTTLDREDECLDLIDRIGRCTTRGTEYTRDLPDTVTQSCKTYITTQINYNTCVQKHMGDTTFPGHEYYYYFKVFGPLWRAERETINLYDRSGLIVDTIAY